MLAIRTDPRDLAVRVRIPEGRIRRRSIAGRACSAAGWGALRARPPRPRRGAATAVISDPTRPTERAGGPRTDRSGDRGGLGGVRVGVRVRGRGLPGPGSVRRG